MDGRLEPPATEVRTQLPKPPMNNLGVIYEDREPHQRSARWHPRRDEMREFRPVHITDPGTMLEVVSRCPNSRQGNGC